MESIRESLVSIPSSLPGVLVMATNFISESASTASSYLHHSLGTPNSNGPADLSSSSFPIPSSLVKEQWRLLFTADANAQVFCEFIACFIDGSI